MDKRSVFRPLWRGVVYSSVLTALFVAIIALFVVLGMGGMAMGILIQIAKVFAIMFGVAKAGRGLVIGGVIGVVYALVAFLLFSVVDPRFDIGAGILMEMLFAGVIGVFSALLLRGFARN